MAKINRPDYKDVASDVRYLKLLARDFPTISKVTTEIINLEAILHLPKSTEHFPRRPARRERGFPACAPKCLWKHQAKGERTFRKHPARTGEEGPLHLDLLS